MTPMAVIDSKEPLDNEVQKPHEIDGVVEDVLLALDHAKEIKLLAKLDLAFIPIIMLVYLSCFLDRSNIGSRMILLCLAAIILNVI